MAPSAIALFSEFLPKTHCKNYLAKKLQRNTKHIPYCNSYQMRNKQAIHGLSLVVNTKERKSSGPPDLETLLSPLDSSTKQAFAKALHR